MSDAYKSIIISYISLHEMFYADLYPMVRLNKINVIFEVDQWVMLRSNDFGVGNDISSQCWMTDDM